MAMESAPNGSGPAAPSLTTGALVTTTNSQTYLAVSSTNLQNQKDNTTQEKMGTGSLLAKNTNPTTTQEAEEGSDTPTRNSGAVPEDHKHHHDNNNKKEKRNQIPKKKFALSPHQWSKVVKRYGHKPLLAVLRPMARISAMNPKRTIGTIIVFSLALIIIGLFTNFNVDVDTDLLWTPIHSNPIKHLQYIADTFEATPRYFVMFFHAKGANVLNAKSLERTFTALDKVRAHPMYEPICSTLGTALDRDGTNRTCDIYGVTRFWSNNITNFREELKEDPTERFIHTRISKRAFPDRFPVLHEELFGFLDYNVTYASSAKSFYMVISLPEDDRTKEVELDMVRDVLTLNDQWNKEEDFFRVEVIAESSIGEELIRAINKDIPLVPMVFVAMAVFTSVVFARRHIVYSRAALGAAAVISVTLSILSGFGLLFMIGVPFTPITQLLPFLMFGIGLDDDFVIMGSYIRMDPTKDIVQRIDDTVNDIGLSIFLTTLTTAIAFALGCTSSIPAVFWLCQYCFPTIVIIFVYQMTFFIACITLDERRIQDGRCDVLCCVKAKKPLRDDNGGDHIADRFMVWFAHLIVRPWARLFIVISFAGLFGVCVYSTTLMRQYFKLTDVLPRVSYAADFLDAQFEYQNTTLLGVQVIFRDVNQSDPLVRLEMKNYVTELLELDFAADTRTETFWTSMFDFYLVFNPDAAGKSFTEQLDDFLASPFNKAAVGPDIARDKDTGNVIASRVRIKFSVDLDDVQNQINLLKKQHQVTLDQPVNKGHEDRLAFFSVDKIYTVFEFYVRSVKELTSSTIIGVVSVTLVAVLFIPHWTAAVYVGLLTCILYIDLLGVMKWGGLSINSLTYISLTMSIGLIVDFVMHILFRYYEVPGTRIEKTIEMLRTMGSSVLLGGATTFLGVLPLMFTSSDAFRIIFVSFVGIVTLGVGHGLILLPVILATIGPEDQVSMSGFTSDMSTDEDRIVDNLDQVSDGEVTTEDARTQIDGDTQKPLGNAARLTWEVENKECEC